MNFIAGAAGFSMFAQSKSRLYATWPSPVDIIWKCLFSNCLLGKEVGLSQRKHRFRSLQRNLVLYFMKPCCAAVINPAFTSSACRFCLPNTDHLIPLLLSMHTCVPTEVKRMAFQRNFSAEYLFWENRLCKLKSSIGHCSV